ncbi:hypothetical protein I546_3893 [Mycobacterium kansasii 732]|nr:hypothetical protein I546_3893 [Mycobacterium kansasii 732]
MAALIARLAPHASEFLPARRALRPSVLGTAGFQTPCR